MVLNNAPLRQSTRYTSNALFKAKTWGGSHPPARVIFGTELHAGGGGSLKPTTTSELPADHAQEAPAPKNSRVSG